MVLSSWWKVKTLPSNFVSLGAHFSDTDTLIEMWLKLLIYSFIDLATNAHRDVTTFYLRHTFSDANTLLQKRQCFNALTWLYLLTTSLFHWSCYFDTHKDVTQIFTWTHFQWYQHTNIKIQQLFSFNTLWVILTHS